MPQSLMAFYIADKDSKETCCPFFVYTKKGWEKKNG